MRSRKPLSSLSRRERQIMEVLYRDRQATAGDVLPTLPRDRAGRPAMATVLETFFEGSTEKAVAALLDLSRNDLTDADLDRLSAMIEQARLEGR